MLRYTNGIIFIVYNKLRMCAEIKSHNEYQNKKETVLGRVSKFVEPKKVKK